MLIGMDVFVECVCWEFLVMGEIVCKCILEVCDEFIVQEVQIVEFVCFGFFNLEIAGWLFLSLCMVEYYLYKVFVKFGISLCY